VGPGAADVDREPHDRVPGRGGEPGHGRHVDGAQTQHSRHQPQSSGFDFAEALEGEEKVVGTSCLSPKRAAIPWTFRRKEPKGELANLGWTARKSHAGYEVRLLCGS